MNPSDDAPPTPLLNAQTSGWRQATKLLERTTALPEQLERAASVEVGQTPSEVVYEENKLELLHYESRTDEQYEIPILVVYALINRPYILDLQPDRSVVRTLLDQGFDVYLIDWGEPSRLDTTLTLTDYVERYIANCVDVVRERSGQDAINVLGYCMGGTMSVMYTALHPETVHALGLLASGLNFEDTGGVLELWGDGDYYDPETVVETFGNAPSGFLDVGFALMDPVDNFVTKYVQLYDNLDDDDFVENFARMETWLSQGIDVAGETYREFLEYIYQDNLLAENELVLDGTHVDITQIDVPVLQIVGEHDHLIPPEASLPFNDRLTNAETDVIQFPSGHIGLSVSKRSHAELWPQVADWFAERSSRDESGGATASGEPTSDELQTVRGIGPAYAVRLRNAGIADVAALAAADPDALAEQIGVTPTRVRGWVEHATQAIRDESDS